MPPVAFFLKDILLCCQISIFVLWFSTFVAKTILKKLEKSLEQMLRFIYESMIVASSFIMINYSMHWQHTKFVWKQDVKLAIETFKILYGFSDILRDIIKFQKTTYNFRYSNILKIPKVCCTCSCGKRSLKFQTSTLRNELRKETCFN